MRRFSLLFVFSLFLLALAAPVARAEAFRYGLDVLDSKNFAQLRGKRVALITNAASVSRSGEPGYRVLLRNGVDLRFLMAPEHGFTLDYEAGQMVGNAGVGENLKVWSLYGETRKPTKEMLKEVDTIVFDIQDIGCRFYTYVSTMGNCMEACAENGLRFVVLDRPNPIDGVTMGGPILDAGAESFVGWHRIPLRHGMTAGELMRMFQGERGIRVDASVVLCEGWSRKDRFDRTGLLWTDPSPNMRSLTQAMLYPGVGLLEGTNLSVGRGTDTPFERIGVPWCDGLALATAMRKLDLPGVAVVPIRFTPNASKFANEACSGVQIAITDWDAFEPVSLGVALACALRDLFGERWKTEKLNWLWKHQASMDLFHKGASAAEIQKGWQKDLDLFSKRRKPFLLYP